MGSFVFYFGLPCPPILVGLPVPFLLGFPCAPLDGLLCPLVVGLVGPRCEGSGLSLPLSPPDCLFCWNESASLELMGLDEPAAAEVLEALEELVAEIFVLNPSVGGTKPKPRIDLKS